MKEVWETEAQELKRQGWCIIRTGKNAGSIKIHTNILACII